MCKTLTGRCMMDESYVLYSGESTGLKINNLASALDNSGGGGGGEKVENSKLVKQS